METTITLVQVVWGLVGVLITSGIAYVAYSRKQLDQLHQKDLVDVKAAAKENKSELLLRIDDVTLELKGLQHQQDEMKLEQQAHESKFVTRQDVKEIVIEAISPMRIDNAEMRTLTQEMYAMLNNISRDVAVYKALYEREHKEDT